MPSLTRGNAPDVSSRLVAEVKEKLDALAVSLSEIASVLLIGGW